MRMPAIIALNGDFIKNKSRLGVAKKFSRDNGVLANLNAGTPFLSGFIPVDIFNRIVGKSCAFRED